MKINTTMTELEFSMSFANLFIGLPVQMLHRHTTHRKNLSQSMNKKDMCITKERYGYYHLFYMNWEKILPYIGKSS